MIFLKELHTQVTHVEQTLYYTNISRIYCVFSPLLTIGHFLQEEKDKSTGCHTFSDSDSKDSMSNSGTGKKKKLKNNNKMLR